VVGQGEQLDPGVGGRRHDLGGRQAPVGAARVRLQVERWAAGHRGNRTRAAAGPRADVVAFGTWVIAATFRAPRYCRSSSET
jgi:hypothetical protein